MWERPGQTNEGLECHIACGFDYKIYDAHIEYLNIFLSHTDAAFETFKRHSLGQSLSKDQRTMALNRIFYMNQDDDEEPIITIKG